MNAKKIIGIGIGSEELAELAGVEHESIKRDAKRLSKEIDFGHINVTRSERRIYHFYEPIACPF